MARKPLRPLIRSGGFYPSRKWTPLVYAGGYTTANGGEEPTPPPIEKTVTGNPIHITDALAKPVQALSVALEPIQDLHGYDNPWPAGGGANQWDEEWEVGSISASTGANTEDNSLIRSKNYIPILPNTEYFGCVVGASSGYNVRARFYDSDKNFIGTGDYGLWNFNRAYKSPANAAYMRFAMQSDYGTTYKNDIAINYPSTVTTYSPYSNICPITGRSAVGIERTGKNLANMFNDGKVPSISNGQLVTAAGFRSDFIPFKANAPFTFHVTSAVVYIMCYDKDKNFLSAFSNNTGTISNTTPANTAYVMLRKDSNQAPTDAQFEYGTATDYEPYVGTTLPVSWQSEAGTVYAGYLSIDKDGNVTLTGTHQFLTFDGSENWIEGSNYYALFSQPASVGNYDTSQIANWLKGGGNAYADDGNFRVQSNGAVCIGNKNGWIADVTALKTMLSDTPLQILYELATPATYTLSSVTVPSTVQGENNLWSDAGDMTLTYYADGNASEIEALNILLGNRYYNNHEADEPTDREALDILLGRTR